MWPTAAMHAALAPTRENLREPAPSDTATNVQFPSVATSNQSSQLVPSCLCLRPLARAPITSVSGPASYRAAADSSCLSGPSGTGRHCQDAAVVAVAASADEP